MELIPNQVLTSKQSNNKYSVVETIGRGQYSIVYKCFNLTQKKHFAIKQIPNEKLKEIPKLRELFASEVKILQAVKNENVVKYIDQFENDDSQFLVLEFCDSGTLKMYLQKRKTLPEPEAVEIFKQIMNGFKGLHEVPAIHREQFIFFNQNINSINISILLDFLNLKPTSILIHNNNIFKIAGLGFSKIFIDKDQFGQTVLGAALYMSPEVLESKRYGLEVDVYSLGVLFYEILYGKLPYTGRNEQELLINIKTKQLDLEFNNINISQNMKNLIERMICYKRENRIKWHQLIRHVIFQCHFTPRHGIKFYNKLAQKLNHNKKLRKNEIQQTNFHKQVIIDTQIEINVDEQICQNAQVNKNKEIQKIEELDNLQNNSSSILKKEFNNDENDEFQKDKGMNNVKVKYSQQLSKEKKQDIQNDGIVVSSESYNLTEDQNFFETQTKKLKNISDILCKEKYFEVINLNGGSGSFGNVIFVKNKNDNQQYAVKIQNIFDPDLLVIDNKKLQDCIHEASCLREVYHKNIVKIFDDFQINNYHFMIMELCQGSLSQWIKKNGKKQLSSKQFLYFTNQLLDGIEHVHNLNYVLRDLSLNNILICSDGTLKLCDFGQIIKFIPQFENQMLVTQNYKGAILYYPPEILNIQQSDQFVYTQKGDIWALGVCLQHLGGLSFQKSYLMTNSVSQAPNIDERCNKLIEYILNEDSEKRPSIPMIRSFINQNMIKDDY